MCEFKTELVVEVAADQLSLVSQLISRLKKELSDTMGFKCSIEEHIFICGLGKTLIKVLPYTPSLGPEMIGSGRKSALSIIIESENAENLVEVNDLFNRSFRSAGIKYRRIS